MEDEDAINIVELNDQLREKLITVRSLKTDLRDLDDKFLLKFLRARNYNVNATADLMVNYFAFRSANSYLFKPVGENQVLREALKANIFAIAPNYTTSGERVVSFRPGKWDTSKCDSLTLVAISVLIFEYALLDEATQKHGFIEIEDMAETSWKQLLKLSPSVPKLTADLTEKALPVKFSKIHIVNQSRIADILYSMMKPLISNQLKKRLTFHGNKLDNLQSAVNKNVIPVELGGDWLLQESTMTDDAIAELDRRLSEYWHRYPVTP